MKIPTKLLICIVLQTLLQCNSNGLLSDSGKEMANTASADKAYIFISSQTSVGTMLSLTAGGCSGGGLAQADCACTALARSANLLRTTSSTFVAWLSRNTPNVDAKCRLLGQPAGTACGNTSGERWYNTRNDLVADGVAQLASASLNAAIRYDENGTTVTTDVWTGTQSTGAAHATATCSSWSDGVPSQGATGSPAVTNGNWTANGNNPTCNANLPVYCVAVP